MRKNDLAQDWAKALAITVLMTTRELEALDNDQHQHPRHFVSTSGESPFANVTYSRAFYIIKA